METLHRTGQVDPAALLTLPDDVVKMHLGHTLNHMTGRYTPEIGKGKPTGVDAIRSKAQTAKRIAEHHKAREHGPTSGDIAAAKQLLQIPGLRPAARADALKTLQQAGRL